MLVVGRPITRADNPVAAARAILDEIAQGPDRAFQVKPNNHKTPRLKPKCQQIRPATTSKSTADQDLSERAEI